MRSGCVVFGRVSGDSAAAYVLHQASSGQDKATSRVGALAGHLLETRVRIDPSASSVNLEFSWAGQQQTVGASAQTKGAPAPELPHVDRSSSSGPAQTDAREEKKVAKGAEENKSGSSGGSSGSFTMDEVAKHNKKDDIWVIVDRQVLDVTKFLPDHPGGEKAILLYAGRDATEEFNMLHDPKVISRYAPDAVIGKVET